MIGKSMNLVEVIDQYIDKCIAGYPIDKIRDELKAQNYSDEDIWFIVREVDNYLLNNKIIGKPKKNWESIKLAGIVLMLIGAGIWFISYTGIIDIGEYYILPFGILFTGAALYYGIRWLK